MLENLAKMGEYLCKQEGSEECINRIVIQKSQSTTRRNFMGYMALKHERKISICRRAMGSVVRTTGKAFECYLFVEMLVVALTGNKW